MASDSVILLVEGFATPKMTSLISAQAISSSYLLYAFVFGSHDFITLGLIGHSPKLSSCKLL